VAIFQCQKTDVKLSKILIQLQIQNYLKFFAMYLPGGCLCYDALRVHYILGKLYALILSIPTYCSKQLVKLLSVDDDLTEIPQCIKVYLFLKHIREVLKVQ